MGTFFVYIIKSAICLVIFYLFFRLLLSKDTFHRFNRIALLSVMLLSFIIPAVSSLIHPTPMTGMVYLDGMLQPEGAVILLSTPIKTGTDYFMLLIQVLMLVYILGVLLVFSKNLLCLVSMFRLMKRCRKQRTKDYTLYLHDKPLAPFSWMRRIVISDKDMQQNGEKILRHELAHIQLRHSWDLLLVDSSLAFQWFNPASWLLKQELQSIHEFEADDVVLRQGIDAKQYQLLLIEKAVGTRLYSMANSFNHSSLKKRITMMLKEKSNPWARLKNLYVLPLACVTVLAFARPEVSTIERQSTQKIDASVAKATTEIGNLTADKITTFSGMNNPNGLKNTDNLLAQADNKPADMQIADVKEPTTGSPVITIASVTGSSYPLLVLNGSPYAVEVSTNLDVFQASREQWASILKINPDDISSITVLKDAAAKTIWGERGANGVIEIATSKVPAFQLVEYPDVMPQYPGGDEALMEYLRNNVRYPAISQERGIQGRVVCSFVITAEGDVVNVNVVRGLSSELDSEAMRVILNMPDWTPGMKDGKNCAVRYTLPIQFQLTE